MSLVMMEKDLQYDELEEESIPPEYADLPIYKHRGFNFFEYGRCKLRSLDELEALKIQLQKIYFNSSATAKGKRVIFHHLRKLSSRITRIRFDGRELC